jgi:hypothetical protein
MADDKKEEVRPQLTDAENSEKKNISDRAWETDEHTLADEQTRTMDEPAEGSKNY